MPDKPTEIPNKGGKNPMDTAVNDIKGGLTKEYQKKITEKVKQVRDAEKIFETSKNELKALVSEYEAEKAELGKFVEGIK